MNQAESTVSPVTAHRQADVFNLVQRVKIEVQSVDTVLSHAELSSQALDTALVKPLLSMLAKTRHPALPFALMLSRAHFLEEADNNLAFHGLNETRATLCEVLAIKILALWDVRSIELAQILTHTWNPWAGVNSACFDANSRPASAQLSDLQADAADIATSAIELAIETSAKRFIRCPPVQRFMIALHKGQLLYIPKTTKAIVRDTYKGASVELYDLTNRPFFDHYVLRIPQIRRFIEFCTLAILVCLFMALQIERNTIDIQPIEAFFIIFTAGFALDELISIRERGFKVYFRQIWNIFDVGFLSIFLAYFIMRIVALTRDDLTLSQLSYDTLAIGACLLFPRLCGLLLRDSFVLIGLRAMLADYVAFIVLAVICSVGFLLSFNILGQGKISMGEIAWLLVKVFLGSSYLGFEKAPLFGEHIGPALMLIFAVFSNTLLLTILISILTNTFSTIQWNAVEEALFQKAVSTLELVKGDALFEFGTPSNLIALPILLPASYLMDPRPFHSLNVLLIRVTQLPLLALIFAYHHLERLWLYPAVNLGEKGDDALASSPNSRHRSRFDAEDVFTYKVTTAGIFLPGVDDVQVNRATPIVLRGSGGQQVLGIHDGANPSASLQPQSLLSQLLRSDRTERKQQNSASCEDRLSHMEQKIDRIEEMISRLIYKPLDAPSSTQDSFGANSLSLNRG